MSTTIRIHLTETNYINQSAPETVYKTENFADPQTAYSTTPQFLHNAVFAKLEPFPDQYKFNKIYSATFMIYARWPGANPQTITRTFPLRFNILPVSSPWDHNSLSYNSPANKDQPWLDALASSGLYQGNFDSAGNYRWCYALWLSTRVKNGELHYPMEYLFDHYDNGIYIQPQGAEFYINDLEFKPYIEFVVLDERRTLDITACSPDGGYISKIKDNTFTWAVSTSSIADSHINPCYGKLSCTSVFRWRIDDEHPYTEIDCGANLYITIPANTFTSDSIQWQVETTDSGGHISTSDWFIMNTIEASSTAVALSPLNEMIDGSKPFTMKWKHMISTGTEQTRADIQISTDGTNYSDFAMITGSDDTYLVPENTMSSGRVSWRVRTYNTDNIPSAWSEPVIFICLSAPPKPILSMTQYPISIASWQVTDQQGWQLQIMQSENVIYDSGIVFGTNSSFKIPKVLNDGSYTARIRVVNRYSLWSSWGLAPLNVTNNSLGEIIAEANESDVVELSWTTDSQFTEYVIYRNDIPIAKTANQEYVDNFAAGENKYYIVGLLEGTYYYSKSNILFAKAIPSMTRITAVDDVKWIDITNAAEPLRSITTNFHYEASLVRVSASEYPSLEMTKYKSKSLQISVAFTSGDSSIEEFEQLFGKVVCVKAKNGDICIGPMLNVTSVKNEFITTYSFTIEQINFKEEISL